MLERGAVSALLRLNELGFGTRRLRARLGPSQTVKSYVEAGAWRTYKQPARRNTLDGRRELAGGEV
jgi:hypothetical protein